MSCRSLSMKLKNQRAMVADNGIDGQAGYTGGCYRPGLGIFVLSLTWENGPSLSKGLGSVVDIIHCDLSTAVLMLNFIVYPAEPVT